MNPATLIVICLLAVIVGGAAFAFIKRFTAKQTCCGTKKEKIKVKKKKLDRVAGEKLFHVEGMHCNHCKASIENEINRSDGLSAKVNLEKKTLTVKYGPGKEVDPDQIISLLGELGFTAREE